MKHVDRTSTYHSESAMRILLLLLLAVPTGIACAGTLAPSGPPAATFRTLSEIEPRIGIRRTTSPQPLIISEPGSYYLTRDVPSLGAGGIQIDASNVQLDLNGFSISEGTALPGGVGIRINGNHVTVRNGFVRNNDAAGISCAAGTRRVQLSDLVVTDNAGPGVDCTVIRIENGDYSRNSGDGILCSQCLIEGARVVANGGDGIHDSGSKGVIRDSIVRSNTGNGIECVFGEKTLIDTSVVNSNTAPNLSNGCIAIGSVSTP
jgi:hypothetical protein